MNWFKENKFVAGVLVVTLLGAGGLGYMLFDAKRKYNANAEAFQTQASELKRLETAPAYPDKENQQVLEEQRVHHLTMIADLQRSLAAAQLPIEPLAPNVFQDQLKAAVTQLTAKAGKMTLPKGFYYGFETYQTTLPNQEVTPLLGRELKAIQLLFQVLLDKGKGRVQSIGDFKREPLPEESNKKPVEAPKATPKPGQKPAAAPAEPLVKPHSVDLVFTAEQRAAAEILNELAANKQQFFITRYVALHNTNDRPPPRETTPAAAVGENPPPAPDPNAPAPTPGGPEAPAKDPIILGNEKVEVTLRVEIVDIAAPKAEATPKARSAGK
ncbi:MAG TPA: Amuc_1100 family pilus-like protein [Chthoniobacteraceae bacterium]|jgi:hypothetical protein|nr:Amuc_1100 family pilus-like protein [Chthoniobacteraceae bacterium]